MADFAKAAEVLKNAVEAAQSAKLRVERAQNAVKEAEAAYADAFAAAKQAYDEFNELVKDIVPAAARKFSV